MHRMKWIVLLGAVVFASAAHAQDVSDLFAALDVHYQEHPPVYPAAFATLAVKTVYDKDIPRSVQIHFDASQTVMIGRDLKGNYTDKGRFFDQEESAGMESTTRVLKTRIARNSPDWYVVDFSPGPSVDPHFIIHRVVGDSTVFLGKTACSLHLFIPGDGFLYTAGHVDNMFDMRRRYIIENGRLSETPQPYYSVGLETVTTGSLRLSSDPAGTDELMVLPSGTPVKVLLNKEKQYLIQGPFGLTGWTRIDSENYTTPIRHLIYRGD